MIYVYILIYTYVCILQWIDSISLWGHFEQEVVAPRRIYKVS